MFLFQCAGLSPNGKPYGFHQQEDQHGTNDNVKPDLFVKSLYLDDLDRNFLVLYPHGVLDLHHIVIRSAPKVRIVDGHQFAAVNGRE